MASSCQKQLEAVSRDRDRLVEQLQQGAILFERQLQSEQHKCKKLTLPQYSYENSVFALVSFFLTNFVETESLLLGEYTGTLNLIYCLLF